MKKYLVKGGFLMALVASVMSCSHDAWNQPNDAAKQTVSDFQTNFKNVVLGGKNVDANQTFNTAVTTRITLTSAKSGTLKVYAEDPAQGSTIAALYTTSINSGETKTFTVAKPQAAKVLYATILDADSYIIDNLAFDASETEITTAFYTTPASARKLMAHRAIQPIFQFPGDADESKFPSTAPAGVALYNGGYASGVSHLTPSWQGEVNIWGGWDGQKTSGGTLYISGYNDFLNRKFYVAPNTDIYLLDGAVLLLGDNYGNAGNLQEKCNIYVAPSAKIATPYGVELVLNKGLRLYNHGTIDVHKLSVNNNSVLYNTNEVQVRGELSTENENSVIVNDGTITATRLHTAGSSHVLNNSNMTISGNTDIDSNNNTWVNNGHYTTGNFFYTAGSNDVINNCHLTVNELFKINLGDTDKNGFKMDSNCGVVTKNLEMAGPSFIYMGAQSVFEVTATATMNITKDTYGIYGPTTGQKAVFHAKKIVSGADANQGFVANYFGQLLVAYDESHFPQGFSDKSAEQQANGEVGAQPYYHIGDNAAVEQTKNVKYNIASSNCNPGFNGGGEIKVEPKQYVYFAFEDLGTSDDFDFNDVVVRVGVSDEHNESTVELCAIGGTLKQKVFCDDDQIGEEVHNYGEFGDNTRKVVEVPITTLGKVTVPAGTSVADLNINIEVTLRNGQVVRIGGPEPGDIPFRVTVLGDKDGKWFWPKERWNISDAYPLFGEWGADMNSNPEWYTEPVNNRVIKW